MAAAIRKCVKGQNFSFKYRKQKKQAELGVPHSKSKLSGPDHNVIYVSLRSDKQVLRSKPFKLRWWVGGWVGFLQEIIPLLGSILQAGTCQITLKIQNGAEHGNTHVRYLRLKQQYSNWWGQTNTKYILMGGDRLTQNIFRWMGTD